MAQFSNRAEKNGLTKIMQLHIQDKCLPRKHIIKISATAGFTGLAFAVLFFQAVEAEEHATLSEAEKVAAKMQVLTELCEEEAPQVAAHTRDIYQEWLARNPAILEAMKNIESASTNQRSEVRRRTYESRKMELGGELRAEWHSDPAAFAETCNDFVKRMHSGEIDFDN